MDTKPLESFAKAARRELLAAVEARVSAVLAAGSVARSERADTVRQLESEIADHSREHVIDKVAYTWFNRLIALRFMDARGYTDAGVVSPAPGQAHGQPEILADAKRGDLDAEIVTNTRAHEAIIGLLDGTRRSTDAEGEAYALLLTEYCRHWHQAMPFMFEAEGAYTEMLVPAGLLADGALLSRAREVLTEDVCEDVEVIGWLYQFYISERKEEVFAGFKKNKKAGADEIPAATQLFTPHWIVRYLLENSLGRLWMLNRPASRLVERMDYYIAPVDDESDFLKISGPEELTVIDPACGSGHMLTYAFDLLYAIYEEEGYAPSEIPSLILTHNLTGTEIDPRAGALAAFALTMKARAKDRRFFTRSGTSRNPICVIEPISFTPDELGLLVTKDGDRGAQEEFWNLFRDADIFGSLIQPDADATAQAAAALDGLKGQEETLYFDTLIRARNAIAQAEVLGRKYSVVTANPPYMGSKNMDARLVDFAKSEFKNSKSDLFAMFIERCLALTALRGATAMITMQSWMFISSYESLRKEIVRLSPPVSMVHLGERAFDSIGGSVVSTTAFVLEPGRGSACAAEFVRVVDGQNEAEKQDAVLEAVQDSGCEWRYEAAAEDFTQVPGMPIAYWLPLEALSAYRRGNSLSRVAYGQPGLQTSNNAKFIRLWFEVSNLAIGAGHADSQSARSSGRRWFPYLKGGDYRKWYGNELYVVDWEDDGRRIKAYVNEAYPYLKGNIDYVVKDRGYYFRPMISYTKITTGRFSARRADSGNLFDVAGSSIFPSDEYSSVVLGFLNSRVGEMFLRAQNPTMNIQSGDIDKLPFDPTLLVGSEDSISGAVDELVESARRDWDSVETSRGYELDNLVVVSRNQGYGQLAIVSEQVLNAQRNYVDRSAVLEGVLDTVFATAYELDSADCTGLVESPSSLRPATNAELTANLISYAVGCMFGRYSLDEPGLILADQGATVQDYLTKVSISGSADVTFMPDADNVIPFVDDGWFEDDVVERFREFLKVAFGAEHFEENLRFVEESLGVKTLRDYFVTKAGKSKFHDDHVKRYKKRPIYWMFSSPKGSFNALIYLHRYTPSTVSTVLNEYLREYENKLQKAFERAEKVAAGGASAKEQKEADRLRKVLAELRDYEHDVLYPLATQQIEIDLDDGVKVNYPKFYPAVKKIVGLEVSDG